MELLKHNMNNNKWAVLSYKLLEVITVQILFQYIQPFIMMNNCTKQNNYDIL